MNKNPLFKIGAAILCGIAVLWIIQALVYGLGFGYGMGLTGYNFGGEMYIGNVFYFGGTITNLLVLLIRVFSFLPILGLIGSIYYMG